MAKKSVSKKGKAIEFVSDAPVSVSSATAHPADTKLTSSASQLEKHSSAFAELAHPKLPPLEKHNRARLQIQSPNRLFFYWSLKSNPFRTLQHVLGRDAAGFTLAVRLVDLESEREEIFPIELEGSHWFETEAGRTYRADIGLYSTSRPFIRILFSNTATAPRRSPSPRAASESEWRVTSHKFAEVLDASGFQKDAFDVAITGNDSEIAGETTQKAFSDFVGRKVSIDGISPEEIRYAMLAIASGRALEELRWKIGAGLFALLQTSSEKLEPSNAAAAMREHFDIDDTAFEDQEFSAAVHGASSINFPRRFRTLGHSPLSSHSVR
jgi:hypothetical protein